MKLSDRSGDEIEWKEKWRIGKISLDVGSKREGRVKWILGLEFEKVDDIISVYGK